MAEYVVRFRQNGQRGGYSESTVRANSASEAERIVEKKYGGSRIEIIDVRKR